MRIMIPPSIQALAFGLMMWGVARTTPAYAFARRNTIAAVIGGVGIVVGLIAIAAFVRAKTTVDPSALDKPRALVVSGVYRFSRNPMYLALMIVLTSWAVRLGAPANALTLAAFAAFITASQIKPEERALREKFGDEYDAYCRRVRRWI